MNFQKRILEHQRRRQKRKMWTSKIYFIFMLEFYKLYLTTKAKICLKCFKFGERKIEDNYIINGRVNGT
jgi:hypothetical protein